MSTEFSCGDKRSEVWEVVTRGLGPALATPEDAIFMASGSGSLSRVTAALKGQTTHILHVTTGGQRRNFSFLDKFDFFHFLFSAATATFHLPRQLVGHFPVGKVR